VAEYLFSFEKLESWQCARKLSVEVYTITKNFPREEQYGLVQQIRRASISVCSNLAEGTGRTSAKDQAHFTVMAYGSLVELLNQLIISSDLGYIKEDVLREARKSIQELSVKLSNLKRVQISRINGIKLLWLMLFSFEIYAPLLPLNF
jgi:four helix bundle protein